MSKLAFLVDDSKSARIVLSRLLKKNGFDGVEMAESGEQALEMLKPINPDAIFVDFLMDGMDGLETITEIKKDQRFTHTPIVMCTANEGDNYVQAAVEHGALGILAKPPTDESLKEIIQLIEKQQQQVEPVVEITAEPVVAPELTQEQPRAKATASAARNAPVAAPALSEEKIRALATEAAREVAQASAVQQAREVAEYVSRDAARETAKELVNEILQPMVATLVDRRLDAIKPPEVDTDALRDEVVNQVNNDLQDFVQQINERSVEGLIKARIYDQVQDMANGISQRMQQLKEDILAQVPEKNDMIEHIRVVTEASMEAHVREIATHVSQETANSVATETVEHILDEHLADQAMQQAESGGLRAGTVALWMGLLGLLAAAGYGLYYLAT